MSHFLNRVVVTEDAVYEPPPWELEMTVFVISLLVVIGAIAFRHVPLMSALPIFVLLAAAALVRFANYRRHGLLGKPTVDLRAGTLALELPQDSKGRVMLNLADFRSLIIYGRIGSRTFRFVRPDETYIEITPRWLVLEVEHAAIELLQSRLSAALQIIVEEEQTMFASIRSDGPITYPCTSEMEKVP
jgi:hypothetical protein